MRAILPTPGGAAASLAFGGRGFTTLYVATVHGGIYRRTLKVAGAPPGGPAAAAPDWGAG